MDKKIIKNSIIGLSIITTSLWIIAYAFDISILRYIAGPLTLTILVIAFIYVDYVIYKIFIKRPKEESDERKKYNFCRATRNAYLFVIITGIFILPFVFIAFKDFKIHNIYSIIFYISIAIGIISFIYYDKFGK